MSNSTVNQYSDDANTGRWSAIRSANMWLIIAGGLTVIAWQVWIIRQDSDDLNGNPVIDAVSLDESARVAIAQRIDLAKLLFQTSLLAAGLLCGLTISKKENHVSFKSILRSYGFLCLITMIFISSWWCHSKYAATISYIQSSARVILEPTDDAVVINFRDYRINDFLISQSWLFAVGIIVAVNHILISYPNKDAVRIVFSGFAILAICAVIMSQANSQSGTGVNSMDLGTYVVLKSLGIITISASLAVASRYLAKAARSRGRSRFVGWLDDIRKSIAYEIPIPPDSPPTK